MGEGIVYGPRGCCQLSNKQASVAVHMRVGICFLFSSIHTHSYIFWAGVICSYNAQAHCLLVFLPVTSFPSNHFCT